MTGQKAFAASAGIAYFRAIGMRGTRGARAVAVAAASVVVVPPVFTLPLARARAPVPEITFKTRTPL
jgi:hypothetical protein